MAHINDIETDDRTNETLGYEQYEQAVLDLDGTPVPKHLRRVVCDDIYQAWEDGETVNNTVVRRRQQRAVAKANRNA